jgi:hypothetical protein
VSAVPGVALGAFLLLCIDAEQVDPHWAVAAVIVTR